MARKRRRDFGVILPEGPGRFSVRWRDGGKQRRARGFHSRTEAEDHLARIRTARSDGVLEAHRRSDVTIATVGAEWLKNHSAVKLRSHGHNEERWKRLAEFFGKTATLKQVNPSRIMELRERLRAEGLGPATVNRYLALLRSILNHAVTAGYLQVSPVRRFARGAFLLPEPRPMLAPPLASNAEASRLLLALRSKSPEWYGLFAFLLLTGARRGEGCGLKWEDVDMARRVVTIRRSYDAVPKSGRARTVAMTTELARILTDHRARDPWAGDWVFPNPLTGKMMSPDVRIGPVLDEACKGAGLSRLKVHALRHAHASLWLMAGGSLADVQENLGHSTPVLTRAVYGHLGEEHRVREADLRLAIDLDPKPALSVLKGSRR